MIVTPKYPPKVGIELCISTPIFAYCELEGDKLLKNLIKHKILSTSLWDNLYEDDGDMECVSKPLHISKLKKFYQEAEEVSKVLHGTLYNKELNGGGCHVNVCSNLNAENINQKQRLKSLFRLHMILEGNNNPYLNWCLNDPWDQDNACSRIGELDYVTINGWSFDRHVRVNILQHYINLYNKADYNYHYCYSTKRGPIAYRDSHFEFRLFDNPQTYHEYESFINIAIRIRDKVLDKVYKNDENFELKDASVFKINKKQAWAQFENYIDELKIPNPPMELWKQRLDTRFKLFANKTIKQC
jgi:hypothetical protein